jgi:hypothetical protein
MLLAYILCLRQLCSAAKSPGLIQARYQIHPGKLKALSLHNDMPGGKARNVFDVSTFDGWEACYP